MPNGYPTQAEIQEFLEANRKGGAEAIANLLREKQAKKAQEPQSQPKPSEPQVIAQWTAKRKKTSWGNQTKNSETNPPEKGQ